MLFAFDFALIPLGKYVNAFLFPPALVWVNNGVTGFFNHWSDNKGKRKNTEFRPLILCHFLASGRRFRLINAHHFNSCHYYSI